MRIYKLVVLLTRFESEESEPLPRSTKLSNGWSLAEVGKTDTTLMADYLGKLLNQFERERIENTRYILSKRTILNTDDPNEYDQSKTINEAYAESKWICASLRLLRPSGFIAHKVLCEQKGRYLTPIKGTAVVDRFYRPLGYSEGDERFVKGDNKMIRKVVANVLIWAADEDNKYMRLLTSLDIFNEASKQARYDTKLLLLVTAMEAIYCYTNANVMDQLAVGSSRYLVSDVDDRATFMRNVKALYDVRSRIIHGDELDKKFTNSRAEQRKTIRFAHEIVAMSLANIIRRQHHGVFSSKSLLKREHQLIKIGAKSKVF